LSSDAPGYGLDGPICWKCRGDGSGTAGVRRRKSNHHSHHQRDSSVDCPVCKGTGRRPVRQIDAASIPGKITRGRRYRRIVPGEPPISSYPGPDPIGYDVPIFGAMVKRATIECVDIIVDNFIDTNDNHSSSNPSSNSTNDERSSVCSVHNSTTTTTTMATPVWMPQYPTEELCNLTGHWRILQRVGSHRWTTDDLVTAMAAAREIMVQDPEEWTLVDKFCFFSGGPINTDEDVYYMADFDGNPIYMLAFLSPSMTPSELYKLDSDEPLCSIAAVEEVESVYDLTERDFDNLKLYHLGPCRALYGWYLVFDHVFKNPSAVSYVNL
jgi:hypothetical protein